MRFTVSLPHKIHGIKVKERTSNNYITLNFLLPQESYVNHKNYNYIREKSSVLREQIFSPKLNKTRFLVKDSDTNRTLPEVITFNEEEYEPAMCKIWLPNSEILNHTLETLLSNAYVRRIQIDTCTFPQKSPLFLYVKNFVSKYNSSIDSELDRRKLYENYVKNGEQYRVLVPEKLQKLF